MKAQLASEFRKIITTKLWWLLLLGMVLFGSGITTLFLFSALNAPHSPVTFGTPESNAPFFNLASTMGHVFPLAIGAIVVTQEYSSTTVATTLLGEPRRGRVYGAKILAALGVSTAFTVTSVALCAVTASALLTGHGEKVFFFSGPVLTAVLGGAGAAVLWGAMGVGVGALVRRQTVALVGILMTTQFMEPVLRSILSSASFQEFGNYLPGGASDAASGGTVIQEAMGYDSGSPLTGFLALGFYTALLIVLGWLRFTRYEIR